MPRTVKFKGSPLTLVGRIIKTGQTAPDFKVSSQDLKEVRLSDFKGKIKLISSFPSLDTPVCDLQVKEFNKRASNLSQEIAIIGISKDLPFAQKRFCSENAIKNETVLSDYKTASFGINYGLLIKELNLLARSVHIIDKNDIIRYSQVAPELTNALDFDDALKNLETVVKSPAMLEKEALPSRCKPCEGGTPPMPKDIVGKLIAQFRGWEIVEDKKIVKEFKFKDFVEAKYFLDLVSVIAEEQGHHPTMTIIYNKLKITLTTHAAGGLTENDFIMARIIDEIGGQ
jgi:thioredoxin-dependent peroxiredoxin